MKKKKYNIEKIKRRKISMDMFGEYFDVLLVGSSLLSIVLFITALLLNIVPFAVFSSILFGCSFVVSCIEFFTHFFTKKIFKKSMKLDMLICDVDEEDFVFVNEDDVKKYKLCCYDNSKATKKQNQNNTQTEELIEESDDEFTMYF